MMFRTMIGAVLGALVLAFGPMAAAQPAELPPPDAGRAAYAPFEHLIGRTWRGVGTGEQAVEDIQRWDWAVGGHAVRVTHSVNGGAYGGETLIFRDRDSGAYIFHYFTSGGFHTTGVMRPTGPGAFEVEEEVHGIEGFGRLRSTLTMGEDGVHRSRTFMERDGAWVESGGFDYREDPDAVLTPPGTSESAAADTGD